LVTPVSNCRPRPTHHRLKIRALTHASVRPLRRAVGRLSPTCGTGTAPSLSSGYENRRRWKISPLRRFFLLAEVSSAISSPLASRHATSPFFDSFGGFTPLTRVLLLPQFARSSGKDFSLHYTSGYRPPLDTSELLLLCSPPLRRHALMSMVVLCSSGANVGASSPTKP
jgi:hypothetical protein